MNSFLVMDFQAVNLSTDTPRLEIPKALGCKKTPLAYDITAACSGFILGLVSGSSHIRGSGFKNVLVIGAEALSRYTDWTDRGTCILFGDAAGAVLLQACAIEDDCLFGFELHSDGDGHRFVSLHLEAYKPLLIYTGIVVRNTFVSYDREHEKIEIPESNVTSDTASRNMRQYLELPLLDFIQITKATGNFSNKLGKGGFGTVYKVILEEGKDVVVKRLSKNSRQGVEHQFQLKRDYEQLGQFSGCFSNNKAAERFSS
ncbi:uncharacterized protein LOC141674557 [Apium graveolens]|uniref:uncharacterized protein LOC141674557 n=1 Tax=Apium graveolens TaxID=4045 RepID=UPI003D7950FA